MLIDLTESSLHWLFGFLLILSLVNYRELQRCHPTPNLNKLKQAMKGSRRHQEQGFFNIFFFVISWLMSVLFGFTQGWTGHQSFFYFIFLCLNRSIFCVHVSFFV